MTLGYIKVILLGLDMDIKKTINKVSQNELTGGKELIKEKFIQ
jgi:hypothetical protein